MSQQEQKTILITGSAGFIGHHMVLELLARGEYRVVGIDNLNNYYEVQLKLDRLREQGFDPEAIGEGKAVQSNTGVTFYKGDLEDNALLDRLFEEYRFERVVNLAAQAGVRYSLENPWAYIKSNVSGFLNLLECCRHHPVGHLVFASSSSVYGMNQAIPFRESDHTDHPLSLYAATKKSDEMMAHVYANLYGVPATGLRFFTVYGPWGRPDMACFIFTRAIFEGKPIKVFNEGNMKRDFTYIDDIVTAVREIIDRPATAKSDFDPEHPRPDISKVPYRLFNIGNHSPVGLMDFIRTIEEKTGRKAEMDLQPMQPGDVESTYADVDNLMEYTHFRPDTPLSEGIGNFVEWYRNYYKV